MADMSTDTDLLMKIVKANDERWGSESWTDFSGRDDNSGLRSGFDPGYFCNITYFDMAVGNTAPEKDHTPRPVAPTTPPRPGTAAKPQTANPVPVLAAGIKAATRKPGNPGEPHDVTFERFFDYSSTVLFKWLVAGELLDSLSVVKRKAAGTENSGEIFLRVDFDKVLLQTLKWSDQEDAVKETCTFMYRKVTVRYRPQRPDGGLGAVINGTWQMPDDDQ